MDSPSRYCPTPIMTHPPPSATPPIASMHQPTPHIHPGYYAHGHNHSHGYPPPPPSPHQQPHTQYFQPPSHSHTAGYYTPPPPPNNHNHVPITTVTTASHTHTHSPNHYQQQQQWQQQQQQQQHYYHQHQQSYPPPPPSPYNYMQQQDQQPIPPSQVHQIQSQGSQQQQQPHALMNLSRFVNQGPTTPTSTSTSTQNSHGQGQSTSSTINSNGNCNSNHSSNSSINNNNNSTTSSSTTTSSSGQHIDPCSSPRPIASPCNIGGTTCGNGQMIPVRLQNMGKGQARTKASMRKLMQEQQNSNNQTVQQVVPPSDSPPKKPAKTKMPKKKKLSIADVDAQGTSSGNPITITDNNASNGGVAVPEKKKRGRKPKPKEENPISSADGTPKEEKVKKPPKRKSFSSPSPERTPKTPKLKGRKPGSTKIVTSPSPTKAITPLAVISKPSTPSATPLNVASPSVSTSPESSSALQSAVKTPKATKVKAVKIKTPRTPKSRGTSPAKKKSKKQEEFDERKANLEEEVAQVLLDLKRGKSKSPIPIEIIDVPKSPERKKEKSPKVKKIKNIVTNLVFPPNQSPTSPPLPLQNTMLSEEKPKKRRISKKMRLALEAANLAMKDATPAVVNATPPTNNVDVYQLSISQNVEEFSGANLINSSTPVGSAKPESSCITGNPVNYCETPVSSTTEGICNSPPKPIPTIKIKNIPVRKKITKKTLLLTGLSPDAVAKRGKAKAKTPGIDKIHKLKKTPKKSLIIASRIPKPEPFQLQEKKCIRPTVYVKSIPIENGKTTQNSEQKEKRVGPSLKVIGGAVKFYRGSDEEDLEAEPKLPRERMPMGYDETVPWLCTFCGLGPHVQKLGDLFGPYFINQEIVVGNTANKRETWMHQDCAVWAHNVVLIGSTLRGLDEAVYHADKEKCVICEQNGATVGCLKRGCNKAVHFPCAKRSSWKMDEETLHSYCPDHV